MFSASRGNQQQHNKVDLVIIAVFTQQSDQKYESGQNKTHRLNTLFHQKHCDLPMDTSQANFGSTKTGGCM